MNANKKKIYIDLVIQNAVNNKEKYEAAIFTALPQKDQPDQGQVVFYNAAGPETMFSMLFTVVLDVANKFMMIHEKNTAQKPDPDAPTTEEFKGWLYDLINQFASTTLEQFAPEYELRPDLTAEAILKAENDILDNFIDNTYDATAELVQKAPANDPDYEDILKKIEEAGEQ